MNVTIDVSAHAPKNLNHQCVATGYSNYGINTMGCSLGCIYPLSKAICRKLSLSSFEAF